MGKDQRNVEAITPMEVDFAKWYTDICLKAEHSLTEFWIQ